MSLPVCQCGQRLESKLNKFYKSCPKISHVRFYSESNVFRNGPKTMRYICCNICGQELSKIAQSGHTAQKLDEQNLAHKFRSEKEGVI